MKMSALATTRCLLTFLSAKACVNSNSLGFIRCNRYCSYWKLHAGGDKARKFFQRTHLAVSAGLVAGTVSCFAFFSQKELQAETGTRPVHKPIRQVVNPANKTGLRLTLYQKQNCPFSGLVRTYLDYYGFSYGIVEVNPTLSNNLKWVHAKKPRVPVLVVEGKEKEEYVEISDAFVIISVLHSYIEEGKSGSLKKLAEFYPMIETVDRKGNIVYECMNKYFIMYQGKDQTALTKSDHELMEEKKWRKWVDHWLVHRIPPNIYRSPSEALQSLQHFSDVGQWDKAFTAYERFLIVYMGALSMYFAGKLLKQRHKLELDVRKSLYEACDDWIYAIGKKRDFMGGSKPNLADLAVYGALSSIEGCPAWHDIEHNTRICKWYKKMKKLVTERAGQEQLQLFDTYQSNSA